MTNQEIFDKVATHLLTQKKQAKTSGGMCAYRGADGSKCAVGCLIPDELYTEEIEGRGVRMVEVGNILKSIGIDVGMETFTFEGYTYHGGSTGLLEELQKVHDFQLVDDWRYALASAANAFGLNSDVLKKFDGP